MCFSFSQNVMYPLIYGTSKVLIQEGVTLTLLIQCLQVKGLRTLVVVTATEVSSSIYYITLAVQFPIIDNTPVYNPSPSLERPFIIDTPLHGFQGIVLYASFTCCHCYFSLPPLLPCFQSCMSSSGGAVLVLLLMRVRPPYLTLTSSLYVPRSPSRSL